MQPDDARAEDTRAWLAKARLDLDAGRFESANPALAGDVVFHAQQHAGKALKAFLVWHDQPFRKTHDIEAVGRACVALDASLAPVVDAAVPLTEYAWKFRYPGDVDEPSREEAEQALATAAAVFDAVVARLPAEAAPATSAALPPATAPAAAESEPPVAPAGTGPASVACFVLLGVCLRGKPIRRLGPRSGGAISSRMASNTTLNCRSYLCSRSASLRASSTLVASMSRSATKVRMIWMLTRTARSLRSTLESIATPCSVKTRGGVRVPPQLALPEWNLKSSNSALLSLNMKSSGNRLMFRSTALLRLPVATP